MNLQRMESKGISQAKAHSGKSEARVRGSDVTAWLRRPEVGENGEHLWAVVRACPLF